MKTSKNYVIAKNVEEHLSVLDYLLSNPGVMAVDTETTGSNPFTCKLIGVSFSVDEGEAFYLALQKYNKELDTLESLLTEDEWFKVRIKLIEVIEHNENQLLMHNSPFDVIVIEREVGANALLRLRADTLLLKHTVDERRPHGLKKVSVSILGPEWANEQEDLKKSVIENGGKWTEELKEMYKADLDILGKYANADADMTRRIFFFLEHDLETQGLSRFFYEKEVMPLNEVTISMIKTGIRCDLDYFNKLKSDLEKEAVQLEDEAHKELSAKFQKHYDQFEKELLDSEFPLTESGLMFAKLYEEQNLPIILNQKTGKPTFSSKVLREVFDLYLDSTVLQWKMELLTREEFVKKEKDLITKSQRELYLDKEKTKHVINLSSSKQLSAILFGFLGETPIKKTDTGKPQVDEEVLEHFAPQYSFINSLLKLRKVNKLLFTYVEGILSHNIDDIVRPGWQQYGTDSGRYSCISEGQIITMPGGDKPIEQVSMGDLVYCFLKDGKPTVSKVTRVYNNGLRDCIKIQWKSKGSHRIGELICTPDHLIKTREDKWVKAVDLEKGARIYHLRRAKNLLNGRVRVYGPKYFYKTEEQLLKEEYYKFPKNYHAHHINHNKSDNRVENVQILNPFDHLSSHGKENASLGKIKWRHLTLKENRPLRLKGPKNPNWISITRYQLLKNIARNKGILTSINMDFQTLKNKIKYLGIDVNSIKLKYNSRGDYLSRGFIKNILIKSRHKKEAIKLSGVNYYKFNKLLDLYGLEENHTVISIASVGKRQVYDLEIENHHNFIANEICVHNCINPNLQNLPRDDTRIKHGIIARDGYSLVGADYSQLEPRSFAHCSGEPALIQPYIDDKYTDLYSAAAIDWFNLGCSSKEVKAKHPDKRNIMKASLLAITYGAKKWKLAKITGKTLEEADKFISDYFKKYSILDRYIAGRHGSAIKHGKVQSEAGRIRRFIDIRRLQKSRKREEQALFNKLLNTSVNFSIQSLAASIVNRSMIAIKKAFEDEKLDARILLQVHDEIVSEARNDHAERARQIMKEKMEGTYKLRVPLVADPKIGFRLTEIK